MPYDDPRPRRRVNVTMSGALCDEAKALGINVSRAAEAGLEAAVKSERSRRCREEHAAAFDAYNERIDREGVSITPIWRREA